jgi:hypothetical protein
VLAVEIKDNGGGPGTCVEPTTKFEAACQSLANCRKQCGD